MGLTNNSVGIKAVDSGLKIKKQTPSDKVIAIAGNPNVGKSTIFNNLTGLNQHTGNWPGKTVTNAQGYCNTKKNSYVMVDIPGTYSLMAHSAEEEVARNFICFGEPNAVIIVCDATCLERNLNLVLQTMEISNKVIVCVNLLDEAKKKNIKIDLQRLSNKLGVPVVGTVARKKKSLSTLMNALDNLIDDNKQTGTLQVEYTKSIEDAIAIIDLVIKEKVGNKINSRWLSLKLLDYDKSLIDELNAYLNEDILKDESIITVLEQAKILLKENGIDSNNIKDKIVSCLVLTAEDICTDIVEYDKCSYNATDRKIDKILTSKWAGYPIMIALLAVVFWLTITGANYPSQLLAKGLFWFQDRLTDIFHYTGAPNWLHGMLVLGVYRVLAWVVSVMLPPMAIFFPLFTLLEDAGYLPRVAYNLDKSFKRCSACGKQALTMCMGFGCNACGVIGCRIINSPRERLIAILTNSFVPCNGRFPTLIAIITMFFAGMTAFGSFISAILLTSVILLGIGATLGISRLLSATVLKGIPSSFALELPPFRRPQFGQVFIRSIFDRTLFVLGRAAAFAAPAGLCIWILSNLSIEGVSLLNRMTAFLDPFAGLMGLDGVILVAFILGFPANEIVIPIIIMSYMGAGQMLELESLSELQTLLAANGWTALTAVCTMLFSLFHFPCATTCLTIYKETKSIRWTALSFLLPTAIGILLCMITAGAVRLLGYL